MIEYNEINFIKDGKPWFPVMGEYQYSRADSRYWADGLAKMKAVGIDIVSSYAFWIHHEEIKGHFNFRGDNNLRKFVTEVKNAGLLMCLRIGAFVHAEARNGGFPDWVFKENYKMRSNDAGYLRDVERYFTELYKQCEGLMYSDGGAIFAIQVENEYSQWGAQGNGIGDEHINALISMLKRIGFNVPIYMATGWGQAAVGEAIPVWGAYAEAPWENDNGELPPMDGYLFSNNPNDKNIGSETGKKEMDADITKSKFPFATVELGSGIQVTKTRRPIITGDDCFAMALCKLGSGVSLLGYYVFHGGMNPIGALSSMQEYRDISRELAGFYCDLPEINYDFQAAIGSYGNIRETANTLKLINYFIRDFGENLCEMQVHLPKDSVSDVADLKSLRYSIRRKNESGYLFLNNYVRHYDMETQELKDFTIDTGKEKLILPYVKLENKDCAILPFNMKIGKAVLKTATASPLAILNGKDYIFWSNSGTASYSLDGEPDGEIITLTKADALKSFKFKYEELERLFIIDNGEMFETEKGIEISCSTSPTLKIYPAPKNSPLGFIKLPCKDTFGIYTKTILEKSNSATFKKLSQDENSSTYEINIEYLEKADNVFLYLDYGGDSADISIFGEKIYDDFYTGEPLEIGLKNYNFPKVLEIKIYAMNDGDYVYVEKRPIFTEKKAMRLNSVTLKSEHRFLINNR